MTASHGIKPLKEPVTYLIGNAKCIRIPPQKGKIDRGNKFASGHRFNSSAEDGALGVSGEKMDIMLDVEEIAYAYRHA